MKREEVLQYVDDKYQTQPEYLWEKYPHYAVLRHFHNRKWYGLIMDVKSENLGLKETGKEDVMDVKLPAEQVEAVQHDEGIMQAYHMNKTHWVSIRLRKASDKEIQGLIDASFEETNK